MRAKFIYSIAFIVALCAGKMNAQIVVPIQRVEVAQRNSAMFD